MFASKHSVVTKRDQFVCHIRKENFYQNNLQKMWRGN